MLTTTKKIVAALALVTMFAGGCKTFDKAAASAMKTDLDLILPEYKDYVQKDPSKDEDQKKDRVRLADELQSLVDEAAK